ncbi:DUF6457 domain-containing protein [Arthrobacter sp. H5]|uniref:DUF6457 domain-containing protein n=1 Tax=Arthrobacter sp. H5 TaxID=1267973 RepID=UPI0004B72B84|nr:DUF6457 domain-containing protein [Arthrobacter sp. H5]
MPQQDQVLQEWCARLIQAFELEGTEVDVDAVLALAGRAAHSVVRPAAPLTTFIAGYAAGVAVGMGQAGSGLAMASAIEAAGAQCPSDESTTTETRTEPGSEKA